MCSVLTKPITAALPDRCALQGARTGASVLLGHDAEQRPQTKGSVLIQVTGPGRAGQNLHGGSCASSTPIRNTVVPFCWLLVLDGL